MAVGITFEETMKGPFALGETDPERGAESGQRNGTTFAIRATVTIENLDRFIADPNHAGVLEGQFEGVGGDAPFTAGVFNLFSPTDEPDTRYMVYEGGFTLNGEERYFAGHKVVRDDPGFDLWSDTTTLYSTLHAGPDKSSAVIGAGILSLGVLDLASLARSMKAPGAATPGETAGAIARFGGFFLGELWERYGPGEGAAPRTGGARTPERFDAVIVGSGFGGAVLACRLAEAGRSVLVLERGRKWAVEDYPSVSNENWIWDADNPESENGWIDIRAFRKMAVIQGAGVGGGSLIYANVSIEAEKNAFDSGWPSGISYAAMKDYYDRVGEMLAVETLPDGQLTERFELVREAANACGYGERFRKLELAVRFDENWNYDLPDAQNPRHSKRVTNAQGIEQGTCIHCGNCDIGCAVQAKNTLDLNYLARASDQGAEIRPLHLVSHVVSLENGYAVQFERLEDGRRVPGEVQTDEVYLAAGSLGTTEILLRSRDVFETLSQVSARLGQRWSANGDFLTPAIYQDRTVSPTRGPTITGAISFLDGAVGGHEFFVEDGGFPDIMGNILRELSDRHTFLGPVFAAAGGVIDRLLDNRDPMSGIMPWFGQAVDAADGTLRLKRQFPFIGPWELDLDWDPDASEPVMEAFIDMHKKLSESTGGTPLVPLNWSLAKYLITPHPLGGARMSDSPADGVIDQWGEVFGHPGLFVVDGAAIPRPIGLNPSRTIAAVAERIAEHRLAL